MKTAAMQNRINERPDDARDAYALAAAKGNVDDDSICGRRVPADTMLTLRF